TCCKIVERLQRPSAAALYRIVRDKYSPMDVGLDLCCEAFAVVRQLAADKQTNRVERPRKLLAQTLQRAQVNRKDRYATVAQKRRVLWRRQRRGVGQNYNGGAGDERSEDLEQPRLLRYV